MASRAAQAKFRRGDAGYTRRERGRSLARVAALARLGRLYPDTYRRLYEDELKRRNLTPGSVPMTRPCPCGGVIIRAAPVGRWPARCGTCRKHGAPAVT